MKRGGRSWLEEEALHARVVEEARWISSVDAATIVGCHPRTVLWHAKAGHGEQRHALAHAWLARG
jgi:hypothetical protein